jgi:sugar lactone lactonase YvrE
MRKFSLLVFPFLIIVLVQGCKKTDITPSNEGIISTIAGNGMVGLSPDGIYATSAALNFPLCLAMDNSRNIYFTEPGNYMIKKISSSGIITSIAGNGVSGFGGDGGLAINAEIGYPSGVAVDASGNIYFSDYYNNRIRKISPSGIIYSIGGNGTAASNGDGGLATDAAIWGPQGIVLDPSGNIYFTDAGGPRIRKISSSGIISTFAGNGSFGFSGDGGPATDAELIGPLGLTFDQSGNMYFTDLDRIRKISASGIISTIAGNGSVGFRGDGGPAKSAVVYSPNGIAIDGSGNIYFTDLGNERIRKISSSGIITTIAGNGLSGFRGDHGPATSAELLGPVGIVVDESGNIYFTDCNNNRIRKIFF